MIAKYFIELVLFLISQVLGIISGIFPGWDQLSTLLSAISNLMAASSQVANFFYFMFGEFYFTAVLMVGFMLPFKFIVCPCLGFIRKIFVWGGN